MIKKITCLVLVILFITLTPISSFLQIKNNAYAISSTLSFGAALNSEMFKQAIIACLIGYGLTWNDPDAVTATFEKILADFETKGPDYKPPNKPDGPDLKQLVHDLLASASIAFTADGVYKNILSIDDMMADFIKHFVDENYDEGENIITSTPLNYTKIGNIVGVEGFNSIIEIPENKSVFISITVDYFNQDNSTRTIRDYDAVKVTRIGDKNRYLKTEIYSNTNYKIIRYGGYNSSNEKGATASAMFPKNITIINSFDVKYKIVESSSNDNTFNDNNLSVIGNSNYIDNPERDFVNSQTQTRTVVIPIEVDPLTDEPKKDENEIPIPGISTADWVGVIPEEIPNMDPHGMPYTPPEITPENPLPANPELPENPSLEQIQDFTIIEYLKNLFQTNKNAAEMQDPTIMGTPSADGTGNGGTGTPTKFDWGDFAKFFDIFFIFIYFIVILILILLKFLKVVFSNLPNIPPNTELFTNYPTILDGVNYIKNLKVGGMSVTVQQAFEYVFLIFFFIFVLKQLRKLYGAYVYEENERSRVESGISGSNIERRYQRTNYNTVIEKAKKSNYSGYSKGNRFDDAINNPDDYENIKFTDYSGD